MDALTLTDGKRHLHITRLQAQSLHELILKSPNSKEWINMAHGLYTWATRRNTESQQTVTEEQFSFLQFHSQNLK